MVVDILLRQSYRSHRILFTKCDHLVYFGEHEIKQTGKQCIYSYTIITFVIKFLLKFRLIRYIKPHDKNASTLPYHFKDLPAMNSRCFHRFIIYNIYRISDFFYIQCLKRTSQISGEFVHQFFLIENTIGSIRLQYLAVSLK